jgi:transposase
MWTAGTWLFHHNNATAHTAVPIRKFLARNSNPTLPQPPYSSDLYLLTFCYSLNLKIPLRKKISDSGKHHH